MVVQFDFEGDVCVLRLEGRFATGLDSDYLRGKVDELKRLACKKVVADFTKVSYIDSTGIGFLISVYTTLTRDGSGQFVLAGVNRRVQQVLELTKLTGILRAFPDLDAARAAIA